MSNVQALQSHAFPVYEVFSCEIPYLTVRGFINKKPSNQPASNHRKTHNNHTHHVQPRQKQTPQHPSHQTPRGIHVPRFVSPGTTRWGGGCRSRWGKWCMEGWFGSVWYVRLVWYRSDWLVWLGIALNWFGRLIIINSPKEIIHHWSIHSVPIDTKNNAHQPLKLIPFEKLSPPISIPIHLITQNSTTISPTKKTVHPPTNAAPLHQANQV